MRKFFNDFMMKKDNGDKAIVVEVGLAVIAVLLLVVFRQEMADFITKLVDGMQGKIETLIGGIVPTGV